MNIPRPEHPNPQWQRTNWQNLNGQWEFDFDFSASARERKLYEGGPLPKKILVPFCPESTLSGIGYTDFIPSVCYRKVIFLTEEQLNGRVFLHFGAVDYHSYIYINGQPANEHIGGYASFQTEITDFVHAGENTIFLIAEDDVRSKQQPVGKQCQRSIPFSTFYTRTTGIWQTVWLEFVPKTYIKSCKYYPDITNGTLTVTGEVCGHGTLELISSYEGIPTGSISVTVRHGTFSTQIKLSELHLWEVGQGRLYDLELRFGEDRVNSYFGMREVALEGMAFLLNHKPLFQRTVLDQGYYPDGLYTAKSNEELKGDIELSVAMGFHGARLHQKVFEKRFLYHCDKAGYIVWGEHGNWGMDYTDPVAQGNFLCEWAEVLQRDFNSPALIGWCPFNETDNYQEKNSGSRLLECAYQITKLYDTTRPCIDTSGYYHINKKEIHDVHDYEQDPVILTENYSRIEEGIVNDLIGKKSRHIQPYHGEPIFVSEYGGIRWAPENSKGWGYGNAPQTEEEFVKRYCAQTDALLSNPLIMGVCYTQLYDIEQEQNGLYYYDRIPKFDAETTEKLRAAMTKKAAIEE